MNLYRVAYNLTTIQKNGSTDPNNWTRHGKDGVDHVCCGTQLEAGQAIEQMKAADDLEVQIASVREIAKNVILMDFNMNPRTPSVSITADPVMLNDGKTIESNVIDFQEAKNVKADDSPAQAPAQ